ncbi:MAG: hypothetical protein M3Z41_05650, partial [Candidatus Eremiobacteraeota bacterium]|nr:hypothetical protein [Candidatus Eremiobacteraeota bacterium]
PIMQPLQDASSIPALPLLNRAGFATLRSREAAFFKQKNQAVNVRLRVAASVTFTDGRCVGNDLRS